MMLFLFLRQVPGNKMRIEARQTGIVALEFGAKSFGAALVF